MNHPQDPARVYIACDLKSFYSSVECVERGLDPLDALLVVADAARTEKTICLAVSPSLKKFGVPGRPRLFEVVQKVRDANAARLRAYRQLCGDPRAQFRGESHFMHELAADPSLGIAYLVAPPQMAHYLRVSTEIYGVYLQFIAPEDLVAYSIDEVFMDVTHYLLLYNATPEELARRILRAVLQASGITATVGIGSNLYLAKVAMDIVAKHAEPDENGARIARLDEASYRRTLWGHRPLTDFWRVGKGYARKLETHHLYTMGDIARCSLGGKDDFYNEEMLYRLFGVNAELLIDHAWGWEPCTIAQIKAYKPASNSLGSGQVLHCAYEYEKARLIIREMADLLSLDLVAKRLVTDQLVLTVGYDIENLTDPARAKQYHGPVTTDAYGRKVPKHAHGSLRLGEMTSSTKRITEAAVELFDRIIDQNLLVRRVNLVANHVIREEEAAAQPVAEQLDLFTDYAAQAEQRQAEQAARARERKVQDALLEIKQKFGKNAVLKGMNLQEGGTTIDRNKQVGGHKA